MGRYDIFVKCLIHLGYPDMNDNSDWWMEKLLLEPGQARSSLLAWIIEKLTVKFGCESQQQPQASQSKILVSLGLCKETELDQLSQDSLSDPLDFFALVFRLLCPEVMLANHRSEKGGGDGGHCQAGGRERGRVVTEGVTSSIVPTVESEWCLDLLKNRFTLVPDSIEAELNAKKRSSRDGEGEQDSRVTGPDCAAILSKWRHLNELLNKRERLSSESRSLSLSKSNSGSEPSKDTVLNKYCQSHWEQFRLIQEGQLL